MADLEEGGYLYQPHTSAGRVPTAAAYRFFVEQVAAQATASPEDRQWIRRELEAAETPEAVMERASHVLAAVSRGLGIFISPPLARSVVEHVRFLLVPDHRVLVVLVTTGGATRDKMIRPERRFRQEDLDRVADYLNHHYVGWTLEAMRADLRAQIERDREQYGRLAGDALMLCDPAVLGDSAERKIYIEGAAQMAVRRRIHDQAAIARAAGSDRGKRSADRAAQRLHRSARAGSRRTGTGQDVQRRETSCARFRVLFIERSGAGNARNPGADAHALRTRDYRRRVSWRSFSRRTKRGIEIPCMPHKDDKTKSAGPKEARSAGSGAAESTPEQSGDVRKRCLCSHEIAKS